MTHKRFRITTATLLGTAIVVMTPTLMRSQTSTEQPDKYQWLEDVSGERSMSWVKAENERTSKVLEADPRFAGLQADALKVLESPDRLAMPDFREGTIYNTWQDAQHIRGILRKTTLEDYKSGQPHWQTVIDYDALAKADNEKWVQKGLNCLYPGAGLCMVALSAGGEDAETLREFDLKTGKFVPGGFVLPKSKQGVSWIDKDTLLVDRDWGPGTMTKSGYPFVVKRWKRGQPLDKATEVYRGTESDVSAGAFVLHDDQGNQVTILRRGVNFFESEVSLLTPDGAKPLALPKKSDIDGMLDGQIIVTLNEDWKPEGMMHGFPQGAIVSLDLAAVRKDSLHLKPTVVFEPTSEEFAQDVSTTRNHLLLTTLEHVQGRAYCYTWGKGGWTRTKLAVPDNQTVEVVTTDTSDDKFFLELTGFLTPSSLELGDAATGELAIVKTLPPQFDGSKDVVEQLEATSKDGTKVPYFVVRRKDLKYDGSNPTQLTAYGGFQVSNTPYYSGVLGKLWLERGGIFVLANIRGGGEFGPAWHEAGLKTHRQRIYDDFAAVAEDLIARKITSPRRLGIVGGSNGGLLMGVEMTQRPDLWNAIVIQVPLLDMLRFEQIAAGASWVGEYGSVGNPEERRFLASISPYHQLKPDVTYPEPLIFTTTKDDRVGPVHARKFAARMEEFHKPFFYEEIIEGGHGAGADLKEQAETRAVQYIYLTRKLMD
ncbi:prolyl oligopeptidase family serine peptidase [Granulicella sibirica]|uniref:Prolyl endopeptidase n=1 Tax=Granulicella sibirica TaxID=2479048 RepID=A0A4Q0SZ09_9BACT|nr:prolyl oligopeptidase family serine peptidase [Granulicella sibirica]RXH54296.1 Prolyl endopeptidase [Granulicella sibirica]